MNQRPSAKSILTKDIIVRYLRFLAETSGDIRDDRYTDDEQLTYLQRELSVFKQRVAASPHLPSAFIDKVTEINLIFESPEMEPAWFFKALTPLFNRSNREKLQAEARTSAFKDFKDRIDNLLFKIDTYEFA